MGIIKDNEDNLEEENLTFFFDGSKKINEFVVNRNLNKTKQINDQVQNDNAGSSVVENSAANPNAHAGSCVVENSTANLSSSSDSTAAP